MTNEQLLIYAADTFYNFANLADEGISPNEINVIMKKREEIAFMTPTTPYGKIIRRIYEFIEEVHSALNIRIMYLLPDTLKSTFPNTNKDILDKNVKLELIEQFKQENYEEITKEKLSTYYDTIMELSFFNGYFNFYYDVILPSTLKQIHKIFNS